MLDVKQKHFIAFHATPQTTGQKKTSGKKISLDAETAFVSLLLEE